MPETKHPIPELSLVLPCFNPPDHWERIVVDCTKSLENKLGFTIDLIIVNDGSTKNVEPEFHTFIKNNVSNVRFLDQAINTGKGHALRTGVEQSKGKTIIFTDIDFPYTEESFLKIYAGLQNNAVALGHRSPDYYAHTPPFRKMISKSLRFALKSFLRLPTDDSQCGIKGFNQEGKKVFLETRINRFLFDLEFIKLISKRKLSSTNIEVELKPGVVFSKVNMKILAKESFNFLSILFRR
jgi:glycosyltransferase involved in cell wall biosynthesis